jgi:hypothetical protein
MNSIFEISFVRRCLDVVFCRGLKIPSHPQTPPARTVGQRLKPTLRRIARLRQAPAESTPSQGPALPLSLVGTNAGVPHP